MDTKRKALTLKDVTEAGDVQAIVATLGVWDHDGDWTEQGFFGTQPTAIVGAHDWQDIMLGKGTVSDADGKAAIFEGRFNLDDPQAAAMHSKLRFDKEHPPALIEWSYGFMVLPGGSHFDTRDGREGQILHGLDDGSPGADVAEVSPVLRGAGLGTGTTLVKGAPMPFAEHITAVVAEVDRLATRVAEVVALRTDKGKAPMGTEATELLGKLREAVAHLDAAATPVSHEEEPDPEAVTLAKAAHMQYQALLAAASGVRFE